MEQLVMLDVKRKRRKRTIPNEDWAKRALEAQSELVYEVLSAIAALADKDLIQKTLGKLGHDFELSHIHASIKLLKEQGRVIQCGPSSFGVKGLVKCPGKDK